MYSHLLKREKLRRLAQARKRAILWSAQQQRKAAFNKSSSKRQASLTSTFLSRTNKETLPLSTILFYTPIPLSPNSTTTVKAIQLTLQDLQEQREAIYITIDVLQHHLQFLLSTSDLKPQVRR